jgi:hypothetical protein
VASVARTLARKAAGRWIALDKLSWKPAANGRADPGTPPRPFQYHFYIYKQLKKRQTTLTTLIFILNSLFF